MDAPVTTDRAHYQLGEGPFGPETTIVTTFTAPADRPVYLVNCNGAFSLGLQRQTGNEWVHAWGAEINGCLSPAIVIPAGGKHSGTMTVASGADAVVSSRRTETKIDSGTYRAVWHGLYTSYDPNARPFGEELPLEQRVSAPLTIQAAPPPDPARTSPPTRPPEVESIEPAHGSRVTDRAPVRVRLTRVFGEPHLYIDGEWIEDVRRYGTDDVPPSQLELEYTPREWKAGRHEVRVIYQDQQRATRWYAWSFIADDRAEIR